MANETERTVTISADYFAELYRQAASEKTSDSTILTLAKERDELKARLDKCDHRHSADEFCELQGRLAVAERCIEDIETFWHRWNTDDPDVNGEDFFQKVYNFIRAWREAREAK